MANNFNEVKKKVMNDIAELTASTINLLTNVWGETFEDELCTNNVLKLSEHVKIFYDDIVDETMSRQNKIKLEIKNLLAEGLNLKKLLNADMELQPKNDMPLFSMQVHLHENLNILRAQFAERQGKIDALLAEQKILCELLDEKSRDLMNGSVLPSDDKLTAFRQYLDELIKEKENRSNEMAKLRNDIGQLSIKLADANEDNDPNLLLTKSNLNKLNVRRICLETRYTNLCEAIDQAKGKIKNLSSVLGLDEEVTNQFKNVEYTKENYDRMCSQLEFWQRERKTTLKQMITKLRDDILHWWDKNMYSDSERAIFLNFTSNCFTIDLLMAHQVELQRLKDFFYENGKIFTLIKERQRLRDRMQALEEIGREAGRYYNRGGQLLKEEKERKMVSKLPDIEHEILALAQVYEETTGKKFTVYGVAVPDLIENEWYKTWELREELKCKRKTSTAATPVKPSVLKQPNSVVKKGIKSVSNSPLDKGNILNNRLGLPRTLVQHIPSRKTPGKPTYSTEKRRPNNRMDKSTERKIANGRIEKTRVQINKSACNSSFKYETFLNDMTPKTKCRSTLIGPQEKETEKTTPTSNSNQETPSQKHTALTPIQRASNSRRVLPIPSPSTSSCHATPKSTKSMQFNRFSKLNRANTPSPSPTRRLSVGNLPILL